MAEEDYNMVNTKNTCSSPSTTQNLFDPSPCKGEDFTNEFCSAPRTEFVLMNTQNPSPSSPNGWLSLSDLSYPCEGEDEFCSAPRTEFVPMKTQNPSPSSPNGWLSLSDLSYPCGDSDFVSSPTINETVVANKDDDESLKLTLFLEPDLSNSWDIEKTLTMSDVNGSARLMIPKESVDKYILKYLTEEKIRIVEEDKTGLKIDVFDNDDKSTHKVCFKRWPSTQSYVLNNNWSQDFVKRKNLQVGDKIGLLWDPHVPRLHLKLLSRNNL